MKKPGSNKRRKLTSSTRVPDRKTSKKDNSLGKKSRKSNQPAGKKAKSRWFYATMLLIPVLFFVLLELFLRIIDYGYDIPDWVDAGNGKYIINPEIGKRYFNNVEFVPETCEDVFDQQKKVNSFRIFVLGESSAAGYPFVPLGSFSRYIRKRLELAYPNATIEVVNISMTGVSSHTLYDLMPGVLNQKPDLILIYTGHNEYYGALGVGSRESLGNSVKLIRLVLYLDKFRVTQLFRNVISYLFSLFSSEEKEDQGTLMSRMAEDQYIKKDSEKFNSGIEQFDENMRDILALAKNENVPVIMGKLVCNLKDQKPFISVNTPGYKSSDQVFEEARLELSKRNFQKADSLFRLSRDLDALRFRAPGKINAAIEKLGKEFNCLVVDVDSLFNAISPDGIVGNNLMTDHLHPNLRGYQLMGKAFYDAMAESGNLPKTEEPKIQFDKQDSITCSEYVFSELDSIIGSNIITLLKNDWPFTVKRKTQLTRSLFNLNNFLDSIALDYIEGNISWADAHLNAAIAYLKRDDIKTHIKHMDILIYQYPALKDYNSALKYFYENRKINPGDFTLRRTGLIEVLNKNYDNGINYLIKSYQSDPHDIEVLYNLSVAYLNKKDFKAALYKINEALNINSEHQGARNLKLQLIDSLRVASGI